MRALLDAQAVWASPLTRALQTAMVGVEPILSGGGCCRPPKPLQLRLNARERQKLGSADCEGVASGAGCVERAVEQLRLLSAKVRGRSS